MKTCLLFLVLFSAGCKKKNQEYTISGRLLISSSNPVPVSNLSLSLHQSGGPGTPIANSTSSSAKTITDAQGTFRFEYKPGRVIFAGIPGKNGSPITISPESFPGGTSNDFYWYNIPGVKDTALGNMFLYKKINRLIVKIKSFSGVLPTDSLEVRAATERGIYKEWLTGLTIPAGSEVTVDTIPDFVAQHLDLYTKKYTSDFSVKKRPSRVVNGLAHKFDPLDEVEKTLLVFIE